MKILLPFTQEELQIMSANGIRRAQLNFHENSVLYYIDGNQVTMAKGFYQGKRDRQFSAAYYKYDTQGRINSIHDSSYSSLSTRTIKYSPEGHISEMTNILIDKWGRVGHNENSSLKLVEVTPEYLCYQETGISNTTILYYLDHNYELLSMKSDHMIDSSVIYKGPDTKWRKVFYTKNIGFDNNFWKCYEEEYNGNLKITERLFSERDSLVPLTTTTFFYDQNNRLCQQKIGKSWENVYEDKEYNAWYVNELGVPEYSTHHRYRWHNEGQNNYTIYRSYRYFIWQKELQLTKRKYFK